MRGLFVFLLVGVSLWLAGTARASGFDHSPYDRVLKQYVHNGLVDYRGLKAHPEDLHIYLKQLETLDPEIYQHWSRADQIAFWINAYNAITLEGILRHYPIQYGGIIARVRFPKSSIRQIDGFWDTVFIKVMGKDLTLNDIEHKILRGQFKEPRIHFALVCASLGCPKLASFAFVGDSLEQQLERQARVFIRDPQKVHLDRKKKVLFLSSIFDWYGEDFRPFAAQASGLDRYSRTERDVVAFVLKYLSPEDRMFVQQHQPEIEYLPYDWSLNELKTRPDPE